MSFFTFPGILLVCGIFLAVTSADDAATASIVSGVNCSSSDSLVQGMQQCLDTYNIPLTIPADQLDDMSTFLTTFYQRFNTAMIKNLLTSADDAATASIVSGVNCSSSDSLVQGMQQCLDTYNIPLTIPADQLDDISTFLTTFYHQLNSAMIKNLCKTENRENYILGTVCIIDVSTKCNADSPVLGILTPQAIRQQIELQCQSISVTSADDEATASIVSGVNCSSSDSLVQGMQQCLDTYNIPLTIPADQLDDISTFLTTFYQQLNSAMIKNLCKTENRENYILGTVCIIDVSTKCSADSPVLGILTPQAIRQQIEFQCQSISEYDLDCATGKVQDIIDCTNSSYLLDFRNLPDKNDTFEYIMCMSAVASRICAIQHLSECGTSTLQIYMQQLTPYPAMCSNYTEYDLDCATGKVQDIIDCTNSSYLLDFRNLPDKNDTFEYIMCMSAVASRICAIQHLSECGTSTLQIYMQQLTPYPAMCSNYTELGIKSSFALSYIEDVQQGIRRTCQHVQGYNSTCVTAALNKTEGKDTSSEQKLGCDDRKARMDALLSVLSSCDKKTGSLYRDKLSAQLPPECRTPTTFPSAGVRTTLSVFSLIVVLLGVVISN